MLSLFRDKDGVLRVRLYAATWLADRGFGKPVAGDLAASDDQAVTELARLAQILLTATEDEKRQIRCRALAIPATAKLTSGV